MSEEAQRERESEKERLRARTREIAPGVLNVQSGRVHRCPARTDRGKIEHSHPRVRFLRPERAEEYRGTSLIRKDPSPQDSPRTPPGP